MIDRVTSAASWKKLLTYYIDCLREENRLRYVIKPADIQKTCLFLPGLNGDFLRQELPSYVIRYNDPGSADRLQRFVLGDPHAGKPPSVAFSYPFFVDSDGQLMPLLYITISGTRLDKGVGLTRESVEIEPNFAAIWEALPSDKEIAVDATFAKFDALEAEEGVARFEQKLALLLSEIEGVSGLPTRRVQADQFDPRNLPRHAMVECPILFHVNDRITYNLLRELEQLLHRHDWEEVPPALRHLLSQAVPNPYPEVPDRATDPRLYVVPANNSQRRAIMAASQYPLTVVTGPPGTGKSQLIVNIVGDAILRGESVLIASKNNRAVDVVFERFLSRIEYPGSVRTGKHEFRRRVPEQMRRIFAPVRSGGLQSQIEKVRKQHDAALGQIEALHQTIDKIERLKHDQEAYRAEVQDLTSSLPDGLGASIGRVQIMLGKDEGLKLTAAVRELLEEVDALMQRRTTLGKEIRAVLGENRDELRLLKELDFLERRSGVSLDEIRRGDALGDFNEIQRYLSIWKDVVDILVLNNRIAGLKDQVVQAHEQAEKAKESLTDELAGAVDATLDQFAFDKEQELRQSLHELKANTSDLSESYARLLETMTSVLERFQVVRHMLRLLDERCTPDSSSAVLDLVSLGELFAIKDQALEAQEAYCLRAKTQQQLTALQQEETAKTGEFDSMLAELEQEVRAARAEVPAALITEIEAAAERENPKTWEITSAQLASLDKWCARVLEGRLTLGERLRQITSRGWTTRRLVRQFGVLVPSLVKVGIVQEEEQPSKDAPFGAWTTFVHERTCFTKAVWLTARRNHTAQQRRIYSEQIRVEIAEVSADLRTAEKKLYRAFRGLPKAICASMLEGTWPVAPLEASLIQELGAAQEHYDAIASKYTVITRALDDLQKRHPAPKHLCCKLLNLTLGRHHEGPSVAQDVSPAALEDLINAWQQFSKAIEAAHTLQTAQQELQQGETELEELYARVPSKLRTDADLSAIPYSHELVESALSALAPLQAELAACLDQWGQLQLRAENLLLKNQMASRALARAISQASQDPDYLPGLAGVREYVSPDHLLQNLKRWLLVLQVWMVNSNLAATGQKLKALPSLEDARAELNRCIEHRNSMAGQILEEQWKEVASKLDPESISSTDRYLDAIQALTGNVRTSFRAYKQQAEQNFEAVLKLFPIWSTTNLSTQDLPLRPGIFDIVVIDEASQCDIPSALPLLFRAKRIVVIGDENQLRHIATLPRSINASLSAHGPIGLHFSYRDKSLFDLAAASTGGKPGQIKLDEHYRSHKEIIQFADRNFYGYLKINTDLSRVPAAFLARGCGVYWVDVRGVSERTSSGQIVNHQEEQTIEPLLVNLVQHLDRFGMSNADIGIVTPFRGQADRLRKLVERLRIPEGRVLVGTIHTYQGDERDVMIFSAVATEHLPEKSFRFMSESPNLLNVAVTRARLSLLVVGDHRFFKRLPEPSHYRKLATYAEELGRVLADPDQLPLFQPLSKEEEPFHIGQGRALLQDAPYSNRMTLRRLLASCQDYIWWYDPYMSVDALDALALALAGSSARIRQLRLLTSEMFWENRKDQPLCITKKAITPLKRQLATQGVKLELALLAYDRDDPPPHDRFLFSAGHAVNMPPIKNIYEEVARLAEFLPSSVTADEFEIWWQKAKIAFQ